MTISPDRRAHRALDEVVFAAYASPKNLTRDDILALNHQRAAQS
jgi:hypothetical protein